jgi:hypothetical protein
MEVSDIHVGKQLQVSFSPQGAVPNPPLCFGFGPTAVSGTGFFNGGVLIGNPISFPIPNIPEATLMVGRPFIKDNPLAAAAPSIFKVTSRASHIPTGSPIDVMLGDPTGPVGVTCFCGIQPFTVQSAAIDLITLTYNLAAPARNEIGASSDIGAKVFSGAKTELGVDSNLSLAFNSAPIIGQAPFSTPDYSSSITTLNSTFAIANSKKPFDIPHPTKKGWRLRHVCLEGPESGVYFRGRLTNKNVIDLPDYWNGLVDPETITVTLTQIGYSQDLIVEKIEWGKKVMIKSGNASTIDCYYLVNGERKDGEKLIVEYEGNTFEDYPGDNTEYVLQKTQ